MLKHISVQNIALIRSLELDFADQLIVLTGETGAGKSLIVDSLNFILGAKADKTLVSYGADKARVEAVFDVNPDIAAQIEEAGYECDDGELLIARTLSAEGKSEIRINGKVSTLSVLKSCTAMLADIHGQHEHQSLLQTAKHIVFVDKYGEERIAPVAEQVADAYTQVKSLEDQIHAFGGSESERARTIDLLSYQVSEIENAKISEEEETELTAKYQIAAHAEKLTEGLNEAMALMNGRGESLSNLSRSAVVLSGLSKYDEAFESLSARIDSAYYELDDVYEEISRYFDNNSIDPEEVDRIGDRLEDYKRLKKKYGTTVSDVLRFAVEAKAQLVELENSAERLEELSHELERAIRSYYELAVKLHDARADVAKELEARVKEQLSELGMGGATFEVHFDAVPSEKDCIHNMTSHGLDVLEFYLSANKGEPAKPLAKVISGGEMSRFMLALKVIAMDADGIDTMVFDEIDTGISGKIGEEIACKLSKLSRCHQVLCISHLPYIAAMADQHFKIFKREENEKTMTRVEELDRDGMIGEISRLVGGSDISTHSLSHSAELKDWCDRYKNTLQ